MARNHGHRRMLFTLIQIILPSVISSSRAKVRHIIRPYPHSFQKQQPFIPPKVTLPREPTLYTSTTVSKKKKNGTATSVKKHEIVRPSHHPTLTQQNPSKNTKSKPLLGAADADPTNTTVYYYLHDSTIQTLPEVVYDKEGEAYSSASLMTDFDVIVEPPPFHTNTDGTEESDKVLNSPPIPDPHLIPPSPVVVQDVINTTSTTDDASGTNSTHTSSTYHFLDSTRQKRRISPQSWENMPQAQDQMIIVSTVATMALLVGALSARRLRSRQFLNSCIENESLEDDLAYDAAYTTGGSGSGYDTFSGDSAWRGDLEKFDV